MSIFAKINRKSFAVAFFALATIGAISLGVSTSASAQTLTWNGTDCNTVTETNCFWSNVNNWTPGVAPSNGDSLVFPGPVVALSKQQIRNTSANRTINDISFTGTYGSEATCDPYGLPVKCFIGTDVPIMITGDIIAAQTNTAIFSGPIILASDVDVISSAGSKLYLGVSRNTLFLGGHKLRFADALASPTSTSKVVIYDIISGSGEVHYGGPKTTYYLGQGDSESYSGVTKITKGIVQGIEATPGIIEDLIDTQALVSTNPFGTSTIEISNAAKLIVTASVDGSFSNSISIQGVTSGAQPKSLSFILGSGVDLNMPNITVTGQTRFEKTSAGQVWLQGINSNGNCIFYSLAGSDAYLNGETNGFRNGPAMCTAVANGTNPNPDPNPDPDPDPIPVPTPPNTAMKFIMGNPILVATMGLLSAGAIAFAVRKQLGKK